MHSFTGFISTFIWLVVSFFNTSQSSTTLSSVFSTTTAPAYSRTSTVVHANRIVPPQIVSNPYVRVTRAIDGDTIETEAGEKVRYIGVNSPESVDPRRSVQCFGQEASAYNRELVEGKNVRLVKDISETDKYGRLLRYVYLEDGTFVNLTLVQNGYARASTFPPDVKYSKTFVAAEREAREKMRGLWDACKKY